MVYYFASMMYKNVISEACQETEQIIVGCECKEELYMLPILKERSKDFSSLEKIIIDIDGIKDKEDEIKEALDILKIINSNIRIIVVAAHRTAGDPLLAMCFSYGVYDIITTADYLDMKEELKFSLQHGKEYKDSVIYRDALDNASFFAEQTVVDHVKIGLAGCQDKIGCTHAAIVFANSLRKKGYMVALVERNNSEAFQKIADNFQIKCNTHFTLNGVDYYDNHSENYEIIKNKAYNFVVYDYGNFRNIEFDDYLECDRCISVAGTKAWEVDQIQEFFGKTDYERLKEIYYLFNYCPVAAQNDVKAGMDELAGRVIFLPFVEDPFVSKDFPKLDVICEAYFPKYTAHNEKGKNKKRKWKK